MKDSSFPSFPKDKLVLEKAVQRLTKAVFRTDVPYKLITLSAIA